VVALRSSRVGACTLPGAKAAKLTEEYTALHEGLPPEEFICEQWDKVPIKHVLGRATEIQYIKKIPDEVPSYHHPWAKQARPKIAVDSAGHLQFATGRYETTRRGIEDRITPGTKSAETFRYLRQPYVQTEHWVPAPRSLNTLGVLEFVRYKNGEGRSAATKELLFPREAAPVIAHDQDGNLHALHGRYRIHPERGVEVTMSSYDNPRRHSYYGRRSRRRHNPASAIVPAGGGTAGQRAGRMVLNTLVVGAVGTGEVVLMGYVLRNKPMAAPTRALVKIGVGLGGGLGLAYVAPGAPYLAAGFAVGGMIDGLMDLWNAYIAPRLVSAPATQPTTQTSTPPAAQALMPGGIPRQYAGYSPAACGVAAGY